ncbi:LacI family DNA-binding transcriptional regulator [Jannaschia donghaensis]|uniref:HTH-type transcriptional repressor CytR n=1 Tax=Jannaschia donghaensis TaxID=420998 RepID=A0A0M6YIZ9_9RHOB|nr:LacI family DNA-binding transcriptional regulator [Jannaschia donghaensis]CTQ49759.1 HTH-type transcriptional repressor CytR [Jannaschia donghaensis]
METKARIADVARVAGVSTATVSRALSLPDRVGAETRDKVLRAVAQTGYRVNSAARDLRSRRARAITVLVPNLANTFFSRIIASVQEVADAAGLTVQISDSMVEGPRLHTFGRDGRSDGILLLDGTLDAQTVAGWGVPVVMVCEWLDAPGMPGVGTDNVAGIGLAVGHLAALGHRDIAFLGGPAGNVLSDARGQGYVDAMARSGLTIRPQDRLDGDFTMESGARAAHVWAATPESATGVVCASDESALGFISECDRLGLRCPDDVSVVGFDDIEFSDRFIPPLTTVHQPRAAFGRQAAELLVAALQNGVPLPTQRTIIASHLVVRGSTARR